MCYKVLKLETPTKNIYINISLQKTMPKQEEICLVFSLNYVIIHVTSHVNELLL